MNIDKIMRLSPVIPVLTINQLEDAIPLASALVNGGLRVIEITLRTSVALDATRAIAEKLPHVVIGIGTVTTPDDFQKAADAGAKFAVSPGFTEELNSAAILPWLPGAATPREIMLASRAGHSILKFFPSDPFGGLQTLKAFSGPFPEIMFCPTGGITQKTAPHYLALQNVICVCGSWLASEKIIKTRNWKNACKYAHIASSFENKKKPASYLSNIK